MNHPESHRVGASDQADVLIAFVDLVQFTALTDVHGDIVGAEAATALSEMAVDLEDTSRRVVKSIGDGVLVEAATCADGIAAVVDLMEGVHERGLDVRAGLDWGPVVRRGDDVFGRTVNLASRLAAFARPGRIAMTRVVALEAGVGELPVTPLGPVDVRGFRQAIEVFSADPCSHVGRWFADPVCGMRVDAAAAFTLSQEGHEFGFCSKRCADAFTSMQ